MANCRLGPCAGQLLAVTCRVAGVLGSGRAPRGTCPWRAVSVAFALGEWVLCVVRVFGELASSSVFSSSQGHIHGKGMLLSPCSSDSRRSPGSDFSSAAGPVLVMLHWLPSLPGPVTQFPSIEMPGSCGLPFGWPGCSLSNSVSRHKLWELFWSPKVSAPPETQAFLTRECWADPTLFCTE